MNVSHKHSAKDFNTVVLGVIDGPVEAKNLEGVHRVLLKELQDLKPPSASSLSRCSTHACPTLSDVKTWSTANLDGKRESKKVSVFVTTAGAMTDAPMRAKAAKGLGHKAAKACDRCSLLGICGGSNEPTSFKGCVAVLPEQRCSISTFTIHMGAGMPAPFGRISPVMKHCLYWLMHQRPRLLAERLK